MSGAEESTGGETAWGSLADRLRRDRILGLGLAALVGQCVAVLCYHAWFLLFGRPNAVEVGLGWIPPVALGVTVGWSVWWIAWAGVEGHHVVRWAGWLALGLGAFGGSAVLMVVVQPTMGGRIVDPGYTVVNWATAGGTGGVLLGRYDAAHRRALAESRAARREAERLSERLTVLNRVLRHDIRNTLNVVIGNAAVLSETESYHRERVAEIESKADELLALSERARDVESVLATESVEGTVDVAESARRHVDRVRGAYPGVAVTADLPGSAPARGHDLLDDAVGEVIENAAEHNDAPEPTVDVDVVLPAAGDGRVELRVADDGPGIPDRELAVLESARETQLEHSLGLGLWLATGAVRASGGEIAFEDREPRGTVVRIRLDPA